MRRFNKEQLTRYHSLTERAGHLENQLSTTQELVEKVNDLLLQINRGVEEYNELVTDVRDFATEITDAMDEYVSGRSEKWQESEAASAYEDWRGPWDELAELEDMTLEFDGDSASLSIEDNRLSDALNATETEPSA